MHYLNKKDQKYIDKVVKHRQKRITPLKMNPVYYNASKLPVYCYIIKDISSYVNYVEPRIRELDEWYVIIGINKVDESHTLKRREYVYCNAKSIVTLISNKLESDFNDFTTIFILPEGSTAFYDITEKGKLWIR